MKVLYTKIMSPASNVPKTSNASKVLKKTTQIDKLIARNAPAWPLSQIAPVDLATLRLAIWELFYDKDKQPYKVIVDEAVEIAKQFGSASSPKFVNGVLGSIIKSKKLQTINY